jgi:hypothetical protein
VELNKKMDSKDIFEKKPLRAIKHLALTPFIADLNMDAI